MTDQWQPGALDGDKPRYMKRGTDVIKRTRIIGPNSRDMYVWWRDGVPVGWYETAEEARSAANG